MAKIKLELYLAVSVLLYTGNTPNKMQRNFYTPKLPN